MHTFSKTYLVFNYFIILSPITTATFPAILAQWYTSKYSEQHSTMRSASSPSMVVNLGNKSINVISRKMAEGPLAAQMARDMDVSHPGTLNRVRHCEWRERNEHASSYCQTQPKAQPQFNSLQILVDDLNEVIFCIVYKAASSTMKRYFASMRPGFNFTQVHHPVYLKKKGLTMIRDHSYSKQLHFIKNYKKAIVVRHPLDRLRSCYYNKFVHARHISTLQYNNAIRKYRVNKKDKSPTMRFDEFVKYVLYNKQDNHWKTIQDSCLPCVVKYDYIMRIETLYEDLNDFTVNILNRSPNEVYTDIYHPGKYKKNIQSDVKHQPEYRLVDDNTLDELLERYEQDMKMFGYHYDQTSQNATCGGSGSPQCC